MNLLQRIITLLDSHQKKYHLLKNQIPVVMALIWMAVNKATFFCNIDILCGTLCLARSNILVQPLIYTSRYVDLS